MNTATMHRNIPMDPVKSSQIAKIGHHPESNTLAVQFSPRNDGTPGSVYHYSNFSADDFAKLKGAESVGSHFGKHIKPFAKKHPFVKVS